MSFRDRWPDRICYIRTLFKLLRASSSLMGFAACIGTRFYIIVIGSGMGANLFGVFPVQALKLAGNDLFRDLLADKDGNVSFFSAILAGAGAGTIQVIASNPMEITKIRLQIQSTLPKEEQKNIVGGTFSCSC